MNGSLVYVFTVGCLEAVLECFHLQITEDPFTTVLRGNEKVPRCLVWWTSGRSGQRSWLSPEAQAGCSPFHLSLLLQAGFYVVVG